MYSLEPPIHFGSTQTHYHTRVKPFLCLHIATILPSRSGSLDIKHPIGGTVYTIPLTDTILIVFVMIILYIYCLVYNCN